jgi:hypothetical protein
MQKATFMESYDILKQMGSSSSKSAMMVTEQDYNTIKAYGNNMPKLMPEKLEFDPFGICTYHDAFNFPLIDKTGKYLIQGGIMQHLYDYFLNFEMKPLIDDETGPNVFGLNELGFGFIIWLIACGISTVVFIAEVLYVKGKKLMESVLGLIALLILLRRYY